ncbi:MAG: DUF1330 domain-containing protein [Steroidobacteraceae bacterium]
MSAYVIVNVRVHDPETYKEYVKLSPVSISAHGGRFLARAGKSEVLEGSIPANRMVVLEFPSYEQAREWWNSEMYRMPKALRQSASEASMILVDGVQ